MNPDATNPTSKDEEQATNPNTTPQVTGTPEVPSVSSDPMVASTSPQNVPGLPTEPARPEAVDQASTSVPADASNPPVGSTQTSAAPVVDTPQSTDQQIPAPAPQPSAAVPSMGKKIIIAAGLIILGLAALVVALTLL